MKKIFIERQINILTIGIMENDRLIECYMEEDHTEAWPGQIYKGIVKNIVPAIKCAFVDIGMSKNAYMYMDERLKNTKIKKGQELLVEVIKESMGSKGPKVNNNITIPGRYAVIETLNDNINISKKLTDEVLREKFLNEIRKPKEVGIMIRTNAEKVLVEEINLEIDRLYTVYKDIINKSTFTNKPGLLYSPGGVLGKILRDNIDELTKEVIVNSSEDYGFIKNYFESKDDINTSVKLYEGNIPIMEYYGVQKEIFMLRNKNVRLHCGGSIVIDKTEAMYVIDVNSGKNVKGMSIEKTAEITNIDAAKEIARQVRLRNLSGIIVIDFIDIESEAVKEKILKVLERGFRDDKNKTIIYSFTELNLVQIARRRRGKTILELIEESCQHCKGKGRLIKFSYLKYLIRNNVMRIRSENNINKLYIELGEHYKEEVVSDLKTFIEDIGGATCDIYVKYMKNPNSFKVEPVLFQSQIKEIDNYKINV